MSMTPPIIRVIYDGDCPFCASYVKLQRLRAEYSVELIDAREANPLVDEILEQGIDLDEGMVVFIGEDMMHGADAMHHLALLASDTGLVRKMANWVFVSPVRSRYVYPVLRAGRNFVLRILGRTKIRDV